MADLMNVDERVQASGLAKLISLNYNEDVKLSGVFQRDELIDVLRKLSKSGEPSAGELVCTVLLELVMENEFFLELALECLVALLQRGICGYLETELAAAVVSKKTAHVVWKYRGLFIQRLSGFGYDAEGSNPALFCASVLATLQEHEPFAAEENEAVFTWILHTDPLFLDGNIAVQLVFFLLHSRAVHEDVWTWLERTAHQTLDTEDGFQLDTELIEAIILCAKRHAHLFTMEFCNFILELTTPALKQQLIELMVQLGQFYVDMHATISGLAFSVHRNLQRAALKYINVFNLRPGSEDIQQLMALGRAENDAETIAILSEILRYNLSYDQYSDYCSAIGYEDPTSQ